MDFPGYIFWWAKITAAISKDVRVFVLENETNVSMWLHAPQGRMESNLTNKEIYLHLFNARGLSKRGGTIISFPNVLTPNLFPTNTAAVPS